MLPKFFQLLAGVLYHKLKTTTKDCFLFPIFPSPTNLNFRGHTEKQILSGDPSYSLRSSAEEQQQQRGRKAEPGGQMVHSYLQDVTAAFGGSRTWYAVSHQPRFKCSVCTRVYLLLQTALDRNREKNGNL